MKIHAMPAAAPTYLTQELLPEEALRFCQHDPSLMDGSWEVRRKIGCVFPSYEFVSFAKAKFALSSTQASESFSPSGAGNLGANPFYESP